MVPKLTDDLTELRQWLSIEQWGLGVNSYDDYTEVSGMYFVKSSDQQISALGPLAEFEIYLKIFDDHPRTPPRLQETGGVIVKKSANHINGNGTICYGPPEFVWASNPNMSLVRFFEEYIYGYFVGYLYFQEYGVWPQGEYEHGNPGVLAAYSELLECKATLRSIRGLLNLLSLKHRRDRWMCTCRSGKKLGVCCRPALNAASKKINRKTAKDLLNAFQNDYCWLNT